MQRGRRSLDHRDHESPIHANFDVFAIEAQPPVRYPVEQSLPEAAKVLPDIPAPGCAEVSKACRIVRGLICPYH